jgi:hypothetical protein
MCAFATIAINLIIYIFRVIIGACRRLYLYVHEAVTFLIIDNMHAVKRSVSKVAIIAIVNGRAVSLINKKIYLRLN